MQVHLLCAFRQRDNQLGIIDHNTGQSGHERNSQHLLRVGSLDALEPVAQLHIPSNNELIHPATQDGVPRSQLEDRWPATDGIGRAEVGRGDVADDVVVVWAVRVGWQRVNDVANDLGWEGGTESRHLVMQTGELAFKAGSR